jgi:hypothetical protein
MSYFNPGIGAAYNRLGMDPMAMGGGFGQQGQLQQYLMGLLFGLMMGGGGLNQGAGGGGGGGGATDGGIALGGLAGVNPYALTGGSPSGSGSTGSTGSSGSTGSTGSSGSAGPNSGNDAVELGRKFIGQNAIDIKGKLPKFTAAGGQTNNCADFVSSLLENTGKLQGHHVNVKSMEKALIQQGWRQIPASQSKPGDVWMNHSRGHVEMVTQAGGTRTIGSNNDRPGHQVISERAKDPNSGIYYTK